MARTQSKNYPEIRESILRSAAKVFAAKGYPNASIVDLAEACNSSRGALYHYFESKEQILSEILLTHLETVLEALRSSETADVDPVSNLRSLIRRLMALNAQNQAEQITLLNEANQLDDATRTLVTSKQREIVDIIVRALSRIDAQKHMNAQSRKVYAMMVLGAVNFSYSWYRPDGPIAPETYADMTVDAFVLGFVNPAQKDLPAPKDAQHGGPNGERQMRKEIV